MPKTCNSASTPYASPGDFLARIDVGLVGDLVKDDGSQANAGSLASDPNLAAALADASGLVESVALQGGRYTAADLQALTPGSNAENLLKRVVCGLALQGMRGRRGYAGDSEHPLYKEAVEFLTALRGGTEIFPFAETEAAGLPTTVHMRPIDFYQGLPALLTNRIRYHGILANRRNWPSGS